MAFTWKIDPHHELAFARLDGRISGDDLLEAVRELFNDGAWQPGYGLLWDSSGITELVVTPAHIKGIAAELKQLMDRIGDGKLATVAPNEIYRWIGQLLVIMSGVESQNVKVYASFEAAVAWLNLPESLLDGKTDEPAVQNT